MQKQFIISLLAVLILGLFMWGCGDDSEDNDDVVEPGTFKAIVVDFQSDNIVPGTKCWVLDNSTGEPIQNDPQTVNDKGYIEFTNMPSEEGAKVGFKCFDTEDNSVNTYQFHIDANAQDEKLWLVSDTLYEMGPKLAQLGIDTEKGILAGGVYWVNDADEEEFIGCSTVESPDMTEEENLENVRYFSDARKPICHPDVGTTCPTGRDSLNPNLGYFLVGNIPAGQGKVVKAYDADGNEMGQTTIVSFPNSICIGNIYAEGYDANPQPDSCQ